jgi:hypothetical protein
VPRDWTSEAAWIRAIADQQIARFRAEMADAVGRAIAETRRQLEAQFAAELHALRTEMRADLTPQLRATLDRLGSPLERLERSDIEVRRLAGFDPA